MQSKSPVSPFFSSGVNLVAVVALNLLTSEFCYTKCLKHHLQRAAIPNLIMFACTVISINILLPLFLIPMQPIVRFDEDVILHPGTCSFSTVSVHGR